MFKASQPVIRWFILLTLVISAAFVPSVIRPVLAADTTNALFVLTNDNKIATVVDSAVAQPTPAQAVTGLLTNDTLMAIDVRLFNGRLYGLAGNSSANTLQLYLIDLNSGTAVATPIGPPGSFVDGGGSPISITGASFGMDVNPAVDRIRVVANSGLNFRMNPNSGALIDGDLGGAGGPVAGINPDEPINGSGVTGADAAAYTNNALNVTVTTLYTLDSTTNQLLIQNPPNSGTQTNPIPVTLAGQPLDFTGGGLDIPPGVNVTVSNTPATGIAYTVLTIGGATSLYRLELSTGAATLVGGLGGLAAIDVAVATLPPTAIALNSSGTQLLRFQLDQLGTVATVTITGVAAGEVLVGIDGRPATGQLFGLGINATANTGTLYRLDSQGSGSGATAVAISANQIAFVDAVAAPIDLPDPAVVGYGVDFNPTVDRIRVVTGSGLNFRINPTTGVPVDGDGGSPGMQPDGFITGASGVQATAYTNNFVVGASPGTTTLYTLDAATDQLFIQNPPNNGTQTNPLPVTLGGAPLDFTSANGFDIPPGVSVTTSNTPAAGDGYAALTVGGNTALYRINLTTGAATLAGLIGTGATGLAGLVTWSAPVQASLTAVSTTISEGADTIDLTVTRAGGAPFIVAYSTGDGTATAGSDYTATSGTLLFNSNEITKTISLTINDDTIDEPDETLTIRLTGTFSGSEAITLTIEDNEVRYLVALPLIVSPIQASN